MAVAFDAASESHTGTTDATSVASHNWTHIPSGTPRGVVVFTINRNTANDIVTGVTYGGVAMSAVSGGFAADAAGEVGATKAWFLGSGIPTGNQTVEITRTNNTNGTYGVCFTVTAAADTEIKGTPVKIEGDSTVGLVAVNSGADTALRFAAVMAGGSNVLGPGTGSTAGPSIDFGTRVHDSVRETTAGSGSRNVGFGTQSSDDCALVAVAVGEVAGGVTVTPSTASLTSSAFAPTVTASDHKTVTPSTATLSGSTFAPVVTVGTIITPATISLATAAFAPTVSISDHQAATPDTASLTLSTFAPTVTASDHKTVVPDVVSLSTAAFAPTVTTTDHKVVIPSAAGLSLTAFAADVVATDPKLVTPDTASLSLETFAPVVTAGQSATPDPASLSLTTFAPTVGLTDNQLVTPAAASLTLATFAATVIAPQIVVPGNEDLALATFAPAVEVRGEGDIEVPTALLALIAYQPDVLVAFRGITASLESSGGLSASVGGSSAVSGSIVSQGAPLQIDLTETD